MGELDKHYLYSIYTWAGIKLNGFLKAPCLIAKVKAVVNYIYIFLNNKHVLLIYMWPHTSSGDPHWCAPLLFSMCQHRKLLPLGAHLWARS